MKIMSTADTRPLFSRDLKHLVDSKYSVAPGRKHRTVISLLLCSSAAVAVIWGTSAVFIPYLNPDRPIEAAQKTSAPKTEQIAPQTTNIEKQATSGDPPQVIITADATQPSSNAVDAEPITTNTQEEPANSTPDTQNTLLVWQDYQVKSGDSLARIFTKYQLDVSDAIRIANHESAKEIKKLMPGQKLRIGYDDNKMLRALSVELRSNRNLVIELNPDGSIHVDEIQMEFDKREVTVSAVIESSLFKAGAKAGLDDRFISKLVEIYGWDIDFAMDLKKGDRFTIVYEQLVDGQASKGTGDILAAEFVNQDRRLFAFRYTDDQGKGQYFNAEGNSLRGTFLRTPMKISRITSGYSKKRMHPVLKKWLTHKGVDYAAPRGTPILATADGRVSFLGQKDGYGKAIVLRHGSKYSTLYAHLSSYKSKLRPGSNVEQGQVIGFVGMTGMATAPHLHYEFRVHGDHRDPLSYDFPKGESIAGEARDKFLTKAQQWKEVMAQHNGIRLAQNEPSQ